MASFSSSSSLASSNCPAFIDGGGAVAAMVVAIGLDILFVVLRLAEALFASCVECCWVKERIDKNEPRLQANEEGVPVCGWVPERRPASFHTTAVVRGTCRAVRWYGDGYGRGWMDDEAFELAFEQRALAGCLSFLPCLATTLCVWTCLSYFINLSASTQAIQLSLLSESRADERQTLLPRQLAPLGLWCLPKFSPLHHAINYYMKPGTFCASCGMQLSVVCAEIYLHFFLARPRYARLCLPT